MKGKKREIQEMLESFYVPNCIATIKLPLRRTLVRLIILLSITTQDFFNILYWLEEKEGKLRTTENTTDNSFGSVVNYQFLVALFCRLDFFDRKLSFILDSSCCAD